MASFNLTAQLNISGPANLKPVISNIRKQLSSINPNINININTANLASSSKSLQNLNANLKNTVVSAASAADAMKRFGASVGSANMSSLPRTMSAVTQQSQQLQKQQIRTAQTIQQSGNSMADFGRQSALAIRRFAAFTLVTGIIYKFTRAISAASDEFMKFNKQMVQLSQVTGTSLPGLAGLEREITLLSTSLGVSSSSLIDVSSTLAQAGLSAKETEQALRALAKSTLAPSFNDLNSTVEGSIALMRQFSISTDQLDGALGSINAVAAKFAVEAGDIITAIQRTGGVFAASSKGVSEGTQALNEFIAVFTSIRATTRESAETIATGLRTIFTRLQRRETIDILKQFGIQLTDLEGKFVGPYEAVKRLSQGLAGLDTRDIRFSSIIEELGGFRQVGKVIPLLQQFATAEKALGVAQRGQGSLSSDAAKAQQALAVQMTKVQEEFISLVRKIGSSNEFQTMVKLALNLASAFISVADSAKHALPAITALLAVKGTIGAFRFAGGFMGGIRGGGGGRGAGAGDRMSGAPRGFANGGKIQRFSEGGVPVALEAGEMVFSGKQAVKRAGGAGPILSLNRTGKKPDNLKLAEGGGVFMVPGSGRGDNFKTTLPVGSVVVKRQSVRKAFPEMALANGGQIQRQRMAEAGEVKPIKVGKTNASGGVFMHLDPGPIIKNLFGPGSRKGRGLTNIGITLGGKAAKWNQELKHRNADGTIGKANISKEELIAAIAGTDPEQLFSQQLQISRNGKEVRTGAGTFRGGRKSAAYAALSDPKVLQTLKNALIASANNLNYPIVSDKQLYPLGKSIIDAADNPALKRAFAQIKEVVYTDPKKGKERREKAALEAAKKGTKTRRTTSEVRKRWTEEMQDRAEKGDLRVVTQRGGRHRYHAIGGLIQRLSGGTDKPLAFPGRASLLKTLLTKFPDMRSIDALIGGEDARKVLGAKNPSGPSFQKLMAEYGKVTASKKAKKAKSKRLASTREFGVLGLRGPSGISQDATPDLPKTKTKGAFKSKDITVQKGVLSGFLSKRLEAIARKGYRETVAQMAAVLAERAGTPAVSDRKALNAIIKKTFQGGGLGQMFESAVAAADSRSFYPTGKINTPMDLPKGSGVAGLFGVKEGIPTDVTVNTEENKTAQMGRFLRDKKLRRSRKALGGQVQRLANAGKVSRSPSKLVPSENVGQSPLSTGPSNKLGTGFYDLLDKSGLPKWKYSEIENFVKTNRLSQTETQQYIEKIQKEQSNKLGMKTNVAQLTESLKTQPATTTENQRRIAEPLKSLSPDPQYTPTPSPFERRILVAGMRRSGGGKISPQPYQFFAGGTKGPLVRKMGILDSDQLRNSERARKAMRELGFHNADKDTYDVDGYKKLLSKTAIDKRTEGSLKKLVTIAGSPGAGKSSFAEGNARTAISDNAKLRKTIRSFIETPEDFSGLSEVRDTTASMSLEKLEIAKHSDRVVALSSSTKEELKILKRQLKHRTNTGEKQYGRTHTIAAQDSGELEAMLSMGIEKKKLITLGLMPGFKKRRKRADELPLVSTEDVDMFRGAYAPMTKKGHIEGLIDNAKQKKIIVVGSNEGYDPKDSHSLRTAGYSQKLRMKIAEASVPDAYVSAAGKGFTLPEIYEVQKNNGRRHFVRPGKGSKAYVGDEDKNLSAYDKAGLQTVTVPRTPESGTNTRKEISQGNFTGLHPNATEIVKGAASGIRNREKITPRLYEKAEKRALAKIAAIDKQLSQYPSRLSAAYKKEHPDIAEIVDKLRSEKTKLKGSIGMSHHRTLERLGKRYPSIYGYGIDSKPTMESMVDSGIISPKPIRTVTSKRLQKAAIGGLIQRFSRGTSSPLSAPDEIPIMAQKGEFVLNKHATGQIGEHTLKKLNRGGKVASNTLDKLPKYHTGGMVQKFASGGSVQKLARGGDVVLQKATSDLGLGRLEKTILGIENILGKVSPRLQQSFGKLILGLNAAGSSMDSLGANSRTIVDKNNQANKRGPLASSVVAEAALRFGEERSRNVPFSGMARYDKTKEVATANYVNRAATGDPNKTGINPHYENRTWDKKSHTTSSGEKFVPYNKSQPVEGASKNLATNLYQGVKPEVVRQLQMKNGSKAPVGSLKASHEAASIITTTHNEAFEKSKDKLGIRNMTDKKEISKATSKAKKQANQAVRTKMGVPISNSDLEDVIAGSQRVVQNQKDLDERDRLGRVATAKERVENKGKPQKPKGYISGMKYYANEAKKNNTTFGITTPGVKSTVLSEAQNYVEQRNQGATQRGYVDYGAYLEDKAKKTKSHTKLAEIRKKQERFTASNAIIQRETQKKEQVKTGRVIPKEVSQREREFFDNRGSAAGLAQNNKIKAKSNARIKEVTNIMSSDPTTARTGSLSATPTSAPQAITATAVSKTLAEKREAYFQKTGKRLPGYVETGPTPSHHSPMSATGREAVERKAAPGLFHGNGKGKRINAPLEPKDVGGLTVEEHVAQQRSNRRQRKSGIVGADATQERKDIILDEKKTGQRIIESNAATKVGQDIQDRDAAEAQARIVAKQKSLERLDSRKANSAGFSPAMQSYGRIKTAQGQGQLDTLKFSAKNKNNQGSLLAAASTQLSGNFSKALGSASLSVGNFAASFGKANFSTMFASLGAGFAKIGGGVTGLMANFVGLQRTVVATQGKLAGMTKGQAQTALKSGRITKEDYDGAFGRGSKSKAMFHSAKDQIPEINSDFEKREKTAAGKSKKQALIDAGFGKGGAGTDAIRKGGSEGILARAKMNRTMDKLDNNSVGGAGPIVPVGPMDGGGSGSGGPGGRRGRRGRVGRAAAPAAPVSSRGGGGMGGMGGYMGQMAVSMAGSAAVEQYAKGLGGEKTLEGRQASNYGGSIVAGASTGLMMGSMIGSVVPGVGTVVGGAVGAGLGAAAGAGYAYMNSGEIGKQFEDEQRRDKMGRQSKRFGQKLGVMGNKEVSVETRNRARDEALQSTMAMTELSAQEQTSGLQKTGMFSSKPRKTAQERADSAQDASDANTNFLAAEMERSGKTLDQVRASMKPEQWNAMASSIADTDVEFQKVKETSSKGSKKYEEAYQAAIQRGMAELKVKEEAIKNAKENEKLSRAMQKVTVSFEKMANALSAAAARADKVMENGKLGIDAVDNPMAAVQQGQISQSADILSNPEAYSMNDVEGALRQNSSMAGSSSEAMVQSAMLPRKLEQNFGMAMQEVKAQGGDDNSARAAVKKAMLGTVEQAFGPEIASGMTKEINTFLEGFKGDITQVNFNDLIKAVPELANKMASSKEVFAALQAQAASAGKAIGMMGDAAQKSAGKGQEIRNRDADTYSTVANSTLAFKRATGEKISYQADAGVRNQARATRLGTSAQVAASPQAMLNRYNQLNKATGTAATAQQQITEANRPTLLSGDENQIKAASNAMQTAANTTAEFAQATQQARDEIMNLPNDIKENIGGIMQELQDVMQERAAKLAAAGGLMEKMLTSTPKDLRKMGNTFNNLNKTLSGKGVSFQESYSANTAYNQVRRQGGSHMQAQRSAQEAYAKESGDTIDMAKELAPLLGAVDPTAQSKMMGSVYESMFAARGQDTSKMMIGDKSMKDYIDMMKKGPGEDPKVAALKDALNGQQAALQAANDAAKELIAQEAEALTTKTGAAVLAAMIAGAEAVRVAVAEGKQIGITPPGEAGKQGAPQGKAPLGEEEVKARKAENEGKIAEAQKILSSGTATADEKEEAKRTMLAAQQENAVFSGDAKGRKNLSASASTMTYDDHKLSGETEEEFNKRKQKLQEMAEGTQPPPAATPPKPQQATGAQGAANGQQAAAPVPATGTGQQAAAPLPATATGQPAAPTRTTPQTTGAATPAPTVYGASQAQAVFTPPANAVDASQQSKANLDAERKAAEQNNAAATNAATANNAGSQTAPSQPQRQGPMSYNEIREQKRKQYEQSRYQKQQQYLSGFNEETREKMKQKLGSRLLENPNPTQAAAQNNQPPGTAATSGSSGSSAAPQASAPMGAPVAAPRTPQGQASQNQGAGVLSNNGFEAFASKLDTLLTKLAEVNIPTEIRLTSEQLGVNITLNGAEVMNNLGPALASNVMKQAGEQLARYDQATTGEGAARSPGVMGGQQV